MTMVKMKATDQLHISSVQADTMAPGTEFEVSEDRAKELEATGLAKRVRGAKQAEAPANKAAKVPANKAAAPAKRKRG